MSYIIQCRGGWFMAVVRFAGGERYMCRLSACVYDAKRFKMLDKARKAAHRIHGKVMLFDHLNGTVREPGSER